MAIIPTTTKPLARLLAAALMLSTATAPLAAHADCLGMQVHAHRGSDSAPENSLSALRAGYAGAWDGVETDMQQLSDGSWVIHHDQNTGRTVQAGPSRQVRLTSPEDWRAGHMRVRGVATDEAPPFVSDVTALASAYPEKTLNAEIKVMTPCSQVQSLVGQMRQQMGHGNWFMTSLVPDNLRCARRADPVGYLGLIVLDARNAEAVGSNRYTRLVAKHAQAPRLDQAWLRRVQQDIGMPVGVHVDARSLDANATLLSDAAMMKMPVFVYAVEGDAHLATALQKARQRSGRWPSGVIIDGSADSFCARLK